MNGALAVPGALRSLAQRWDTAGRPQQSAIAWPRAGWTASFPENDALWVRLAERLGRDHVRAIAASAATGEAAAFEAFMASMAWGYGNVGYGPWRTRRILNANRDAGARLRRAAEIQATSGAVEAYRYLANEGRLKYLGPAFATKYLHFVPQAASGPPALILDAIVSRAIRSMTDERLRPTVWRTATYARYLDVVVGWSTVLGVEPATVEMLLFVGQSPGQWTEPWLRDG